MVNRVKIIFVNGKEEMGNLKIINKKGVGISKNKFVDLFLVGVGFLSKVSKYFGEGKCINVSKKKENATNVALTVKHKVFTNLDNYNNSNYINVSFNDNNVEEASVALMVKHQPHELGLHGHPGSIPGWGASTFNLFKVCKIKGAENE